ncbi:MAG: serine O-acetyltransferase [Lachnospiraceae bacterium]|nr:serine O-acetyltransferase [Lachnospiraceae bacterium]
MGVISRVKEEIAIIKERDPAMHSDWEVFLYPSFRAIMNYRVAHKLYVNGHFFLARFLSQRSARKTGIEIHPGAQIGRGLFIDHGHGVVIGETAIVGDNVTMYQGVTLGGNGKEHGKRHPTIGNNVMISAGAKVLGSFEIGDNSKIGAGSVVLSPVPSNCTVVGVPGRIVKRNNISCPSAELNHVDLPDPIKEEINSLKQNKDTMEQRVQELEQMVQKLAEMVK